MQAPGKCKQVGSSQPPRVALTATPTAPIVERSRVDVILPECGFWDTERLGTGSALKAVSSFLQDIQATRTHLSRCASIGAGHGGAKWQTSRMMHPVRPRRKPVM